MVLMPAGRIYILYMIEICFFSSRYYAISLEFKTFDENGLLVMINNAVKHQNMVLNLQVIRFTCNGKYCG